MKPPVPIRAAVEKMRAYNPPLEGRTKKLRLDFNENPIGCSPKVRQALARLTSAEIGSYRKNLARSILAQAKKLDRIAQIKVVDLIRS